MYVNIAILIYCELNKMFFFYSCIINNETFYYAQLIPTSLLMLINCILFVLVLRSIVDKSFKSKTNQRVKSKQKPLPVVAFGITLLFGLTWCFAFLAIGKARLIFQWLFSITCGSQGFFLFLFFVVFNSEIRKHCVQYY